MIKKSIKISIKVAVRAIVTNDNQMVMMVKRANDDFEGGKWCLVGGKRERDEKLIQAINREVLEEIGTKLKLKYYTNSKNQNKDTGTTWVTHYYLGNLSVLPTKINQSEISEVGFFSKESLESLDIAFDHKEVLSNFYKSRIGKDKSPD